MYGHFSFTVFISLSLIPAISEILALRLQHDYRTYTSVWPVDRNEISNQSVCTNEGGGCDILGRKYHLR